MSSNPVYVDVATADVSATAGSDYVSNSQIGFTIPPNTSNQTFSVTIKGDAASESDELFVVNLSNAVGATISDSQAEGLITNDDSLPVISINDVSEVEGNSGTTLMTFKATLSAPSTSPVVFYAESLQDTAWGGFDYSDFYNQLGVIAPGNTSADIVVTVYGDVEVEQDETFRVGLQSASGAVIGDGQGQGVILNDDIAPPSLSIGDVSVAEGDAGTKMATFTVSLSAPAASAVKFDIATVSDTASGRSDYVSKSATGVVIAAGSTSRTFNVVINGDTNPESDEVFLVNLSNPVGAMIGDGQAIGWIMNDDAAAPPTLSIGDVSIAEGDSLTKNATFTVALSAPQPGPVYFDIATANGTASGKSDYVSKSAIAVQIAAGATTRTFNVVINGDTDPESDETFLVKLSNPVGATLADGQAVGTISNDDAAVAPTLSIGDVTIAEGKAGTKNATFTVTMSSPQPGPVAFDIATANGTASGRSDYVSKSATAVQIATGATTRTFNVVINGDTEVEPDESFLVNLSNPVGATIADGQAVGTISNDDAATLSAAGFDARGLVDDVDDGNHQPQIARGEYATLLADSARNLCRRAPGATVIAVEGVENKRVLSDLADAAFAICAGKPQYTTVMAEGDSRGFLIATPAKGELGTTVLRAPELDAAAHATTLSILGAGHSTPLTIVLAGAQTGKPRDCQLQSKALFDQLQRRAKANPDEALVLLGASRATGLVDLTAREFDAKRPRNATPAQLPAEHVLVNDALLKRYRKPAIELAPLPANEAPAQLLKLQ
jgi:chitinase